MGSKTAAEEVEGGGNAVAGVEEKQVTITAETNANTKTILSPTIPEKPKKEPQVIFEKGFYVFLDKDGNRIKSVPRIKEERRKIKKKIDKDEYEVVKQHWLATENNPEYYVIKTIEEEIPLTDTAKVYRQITDKRITLWDVRGKKLWEKTINKLVAVCIAKNVPIVGITCNKNDEPFPKIIVIFDKNGQKIYYKEFKGKEAGEEISGVSGRIELSDDGKYLLYSSVIDHYCLNLETKKWWRIKIYDDIKGNSSVSFKGDKIIVSWDREKIGNDLYDVYDMYSLDGNLLKSYKEKVIWK